MKDQLENHLRNSEDDYLWDQTGDADPEIQKLEQVLGTLRYQPQPLVIPDDLEIRRPALGRFGPRLAIAATILLAIGAGALWLTMSPRQQPQLADTNTKAAHAEDSMKAAVDVTQDVLKEVPQDVEALAPTPENNPATADSGSKPGSRYTRTPRGRTGKTGPANERQVKGPEAPVLAANELRDAEASKEQLMLALRFASAKLNVALKKTQNPNRNLINNQHRVG